MALVSQESIERLERLRSQALSAKEFKQAYQYAIRGLESSIILLKSIQEQTKDCSIIITKE